MRNARMALSSWAAPVAALGLAGCFSYPGTPSLPMQPRPVSRAVPAADLRIPPGAVALAPEIPLVPLPVPQLDRPTVENPSPIEPATALGNPEQPLPAYPTPAQNRPAGTILPPGAQAQRNSATSDATITTTSGPAPLIGGSLRRLQQQAAERYAGMDSYIVRLTRRENVKGKDKPQEVILFKFRRDPWSLHFRWLDGDCAGREVVYVKDHYENKLHTLLAAGDIPLTPAGKRLALPIDSMLVRNAGRHPITEAGIGASISRLGVLLDAAERGDRRWGTVNDLGAQPRPEFPLPAPTVEHVIPRGAEDDLPGGGRRIYCFDPDTKLPLLVQTQDDRGKEVEYYFYSHLLYPVKLDDDDFNPDKLWGQPATSRSQAPPRRP